MLSPNWHILTHISQIMAVFESTAWIFLVLYICSHCCKLLGHDEFQMSEIADILKLKMLQAEICFWNMFIWVIVQHSLNLFASMGSGASRNTNPKDGFRPAGVPNSNEYRRVLSCGLGHSPREVGQQLTKKFAFDSFKMDCSFYIHFTTIDFKAILGFLASNPPFYTPGNQWSFFMALLSGRSGTFQHGYARGGVVLACRLLRRKRAACLCCWVTSFLMWHEKIADSWETWS